MQADKLSLVVAGAIFSLIFTGILGALFRQWLDRAKPQVSLASFVLDGGTEKIVVPEHIIALSKQDWVKTLHKYEDYQKLRSTVTELKKTCSRLRLAKELCAEWILRNKDWEKNTTTPATLDNIALAPYIYDETVGGIISGGTRRAEIAPPPDSLESLENHSNVTELLESEGDLILYMTDRYVRVRLSKAHAEVEKRALRTVGASFAKGHRSNIFHYISEAHRKAANDIIRLTDLAESLEKLILPASYLSVSALLLNTGANAAVVRPYARLDFLNEELAGKPVLMRVSERNSKTQPKESNGLLDRMLAKEFEERSSGDDVLVKEAFPSPADTQYLLIPPRSSMAINLVAMAPLGKSSERVLSMYSASVLRCSCTLLTTEDKRFSSKPVVFGKQPTSAETRLLGCSEQPSPSDA